ncbi:MAG: hypothetical protein LBK41_04855 [Clostridiales bacterium]|nr:hypothetical protein [Clostridiales bacterium]
MTRFALYEKNEGRDDLRKMTYFINDYVYRKNSGIRFGVLVGCVILIILYTLHKIVMEKLDIFTDINYVEELSRIGVFVVITLIVYSIIGTVIHMIEYRKARLRATSYLNELQELEELER